MIQDRFFMEKSTKKSKRRSLTDLAMATAAALLVHLLLLVLFHHAPVAGDVQIANSAFITQVPLNTAENQDLAKWVELHDPSLMVATDRRNGFSSVMEKINRPRQLEDLPLPPSLSVPRSPVLSDTGCSLPGGAVLPGDTAFLLNFQTGHPGLVTLTLNDRKLNDLDDLRKLLSAQMPSIQSPRTTVLYAAGAVQAGWQSQIYMLQSSGNAELDRRAFSGANLLLAMPAMANISGELAFIWPATGKGGKN